MRDNRRWHNDLLVIMLQEDKVKLGDRRVNMHSKGKNWHWKGVCVTCGEGAEGQTGIWMDG